MLSVPLVIFRRIQKKHMVSHSRYHIDNSCRKCSCQKSFASPLAYDRDQKKEADTCSANGVTLLRRPPSAPSDSPIVSNARGCAGALPTGLRKWCAGRYPSTSYTSSRSWMRRHGWYPTWGAPTTSLMLSSAYSPERIQYKIAVLTPVKRSTVGSRPFPVAASQTWNSLPKDVTSASTQRSFEQRLKTRLFRQCFSVL